MKIFSAATNQIYAMKCKMCNKEVLFSMFNDDTKDCKRGNCWMKTKKAREVAAELKGCSSSDFIPIVVGSVNLYPQKTYDPIRPNDVFSGEAFNEYGYCD